LAKTEVGAVFILAEKIVPRGDWIGHLIGLILGGWGVWLIAEVIV